MNWKDLIAEVARRTDLPQKQVRTVLETTVTLITEEVVQGNKVHVRDLMTVTSRWTKERTLRSVSDFRKLRLDGRHVARFRPAAALRRALSEKTPQRFQSPEHQQAWRVAETLVGDLALYHSDKAPSLTSDTPPDQVHAACKESFGPLWERVLQTWSDKVDAAHRPPDDFVALAARERFAS